MRTPAQINLAQEPAKLADLIESVIFGAGNLIDGRQLLLLRNAVDDLRAAAAERELCEVPA